MNKKTIKEICHKLGIGIASIHDVFLFYELVTNSPNNAFSNEIITAASIFVSCKISETPKRIRDIVNVLYLVKNKHEILSKETDEKDLTELLKKDDFSKKETILKTMLSISLFNYNLIKEEILSTEQHLLRLLSFSFKRLSKEVLINLFNFCEKSKLNPNQIQLAWDILLYLYEDLSANEINLNDTMILCIIINIVIEVYDNLTKDICNDISNNDNIKEQKQLFNELKSSFNFTKEKYNSYLIVILKNYYKCNDNDNDNDNNNNNKDNQIQETHIRNDNNSKSKQIE